MEWLDAQNPTGSRLFRRSELNSYTFDDIRLPLAASQQGIRKPKSLGAALSILTTYTPPGQRPPYNDAVGPDGFCRYKYRGDDPCHYENRALRTALSHRLPLIWFIAAAPGAYVPVYPVWIVAEQPEHLQFVLAVDEAQRLVPVGSPIGADERVYLEHVTRQRVQQPLFRALVLQAYDSRCAICRLRYPSLLDAAQILADGHPRGTTEVVNGLALCKIHHAAFDANLLGVRPDLVVVVRPDVRSAKDGPMLRHGLQEMDGTRLLVPASRAARPDPERLEERYAAFVQAG